MSKTGDYYIDKMDEIPYLIIAPDYRNSSAGVRALHKLCHYLNECGSKAYVSTKKINPEWNEKGLTPVEAKEFAKGDVIVVYPEVVSGNPYNGQTVVRYILNHPGFLGGDLEYPESEILFCYSDYLQRYVPDESRILTVPVIEDFFKDENLERKGNCFFIGKAILKGQELSDDDRKSNLEIPSYFYNQFKQITSEYPATRQELAQLLKTTENIYIYDDMTCLTEEARRCGCKVILPGGEQKGKKSYAESIVNFDEQLRNFIKVTQDEANQINISFKKYVNQVKSNIAFGCLVNDRRRFQNVLYASQIGKDINIHTNENAEYATKGLNELLDVIEQDKNIEIVVLTHQDMYYREGWIEKLRKCLSELPEDWIIAGIIGKDWKGVLQGSLRDTRLPNFFILSKNEDYPIDASCIDECCIIVNLKSGFRFDETLKGFDLYGTLACLQVKEAGGTAWIINNIAEHYITRPFSWLPDETFQKSWTWLYEKYKTKGLQPYTTVLADTSILEALDKINKENENKEE